MKLGDRRDQAEAQPRSGHRPAGSKAHEPFQDRPAIGLGDVDRFDLGTAGNPHQVFARAIGRDLFRHDLGDLDDDALTGLRRERVGFVFQFFNLLPTLTLAENIALPLLLAGVSPAEGTARAREGAERVGLGHRLAHFPAQVSGGELQRAAVARALIHKPALLIADEPTGNLDTESGQRVLEVLRTLHRETGVAVLLATHDALIAGAADRVLRMRDGVEVPATL